MAQMINWCYRNELGLNPYLGYTISFEVTGLNIFQPFSTTLLNWNSMWITTYVRCATYRTSLQLRMFKSAVIMRINDGSTSFSVSSYAGVHNHSAAAFYCQLVIMAVSVIYTGLLPLNPRKHTIRSTRSALRRDSEQRLEMKYDGIFKNSW